MPTLLRTAFVLLLLGLPAAVYAQTPAEADSLFRAGAWAEAADAYARLAEADTSNGVLRYRLGVSLLENGRAAEAAEALEALTRRGPAHPLVHAQAGRAHAALGHADAAFTHLDAAAERGFGSKGFLDDPAFAGLRDDARFEAVAAGIDRNARPCAYDEAARQFDFWVGTWEVHNAAGGFAGRNVITLEEAECVLVERWQGGGGGTGMSINYYDPGSQQWTQQWVSAAGYVIRIDGGLLDDGSMQLVGTLTQRDGTRVPFRGTWTPLPDGRVRQHFEQSADDGATWQTWFDGYYTRVDGE